MNCPDCGEHVFGHKCGCGWYFKPEVPTPRYKGPPEPNRTVEWDAHKNAAVAAARSIGNSNPRAWAYKIIEKHRNGEPVNLVALANAETAVRTDYNKEVA